MNPKQIAFIICVNNKQEYTECRHYIERLYIPNGYETEVIAIEGASSMANGYNAGMRRSDAEYKIYLHQDVFIRNRYLIRDLLQLFALDESIGMAGVIGAKKLDAAAVAVAGWDSGSIQDNCNPFCAVYQPAENGFMEVQAADGLFLATRHDLRWREDIFDGWDFYDISQCMEFRKAGYKVVVPYQKEPWCYHDNAYSKMLRYEHYRERFCLKYAKMGNFLFRKRSEHLLAYEQAKETARKEIEALMAAGYVKELRDLFSNANNQGYLYLREYESIVQIDWLEETNRSPIRFWEAGMTNEELFLKLRNLKYALKRIEYQAEKTGDQNWIEQNYSQYAVAVVCQTYVSDGCHERVMEGAGIS